MTSRQTVSDFLSDIRHGGSLDGASAIGEAVGEPHLIVRVALWRDTLGHITQARWRANTCATLIAYAELACDLIENGIALDEISSERLQAGVLGVHPQLRERADLVARAVRETQAISSRTGGSR